MEQTNQVDAYLVAYGNEFIAKAYCEKCRGYYFVIDGVLACCGREMEIEKPREQFRESSAPMRRLGPTEAYKKEQLMEQGHLCFYCLRQFGSIVYKKNREISLKIHWDHMVPFSYSQNNHNHNFVAACHICNEAKSNLIFPDIGGARDFLDGYWKENSIADKPKKRIEEESYERVSPIKELKPKKHRHKLANKKPKARKYITKRCVDFLRDLLSSYRRKPQCFSVRDECGRENDLTRFSIFAIMANDGGRYCGDS